jgi:hypothetical protein
VSAPAEIILHHTFDPCRTSQRNLKVYYAELEYFGKNVSYFKEEINKMILRCYRLLRTTQENFKSIERAYPKRTLLFGEALRFLASNYTKSVPMDALRLEAYRSILSGEITSGGDLLRMAVNSLRAKEAERSMVKEITLEELPYNNPLMWKKTMGDIFDFLFDSKYPKLSGIIDCIKCRLVDVAFDNMQIKDRKNRTGNYSITTQLRTPPTVHVTRFLLPSDVRESYRKQLADDPELGPFLERLRSYIIIR